MRRRPAIFLASLFAAFIFISPHANAQPADRIPAVTDDSRTVTLAGNQHPLARMEYDAGPAAPETRLERMILVLQSGATQQQELEALLAAQQDPRSPLYHQWLTPESFAERFGASSNDIGRIVAWLGAQGFSIDEIPAGGRAIVFSGSAAQVQAAFHTPIDRYRVRGQAHLANAADPQIPEALAGVAAGVASLHDFRRQPMHTAPQTSPQYSGGGGNYYLSPADFATIYDIDPLYANGVSGTGESIAIVGRTNIPMSDVSAFRQNFGLPANNPTVIVNGTDPGVVSQDELSEADLDVEWSGAVAPQATVNFVVSASTNTTDGVDLSAEYIVSHNLAAVMSTSFGSCEQYMGSAELSFYNNLWQQAAAQGITALVAAGDSGAAGCDGGSDPAATGPQAVNGLCSTPYSVCVGGTEFNEGANAAQYWSTANASNWSSARGYIPEMVWNESGANGGTGLWAGGGGASAYYPKPSWQSGPGVPADGLRDVPDVSLTASGHDCYLMYQEGSLVGIAGTSAASPSFAGLMALVNQQTGSRQGNANVSLYALASLQESGGRAYFHDVTTGNNTVPGLIGFSAAPGYDRASGLGSVDAAVLVNHWTDANSSGQPAFTLTVTPGTAALAAGGAQTVAAQVTATGGFNAAVTLSASGMPAGVTAVFPAGTLPAPGSGSSSLNIAAASTVASGVYAIRITATGGGLTQTFNLPLTISGPGCTLAASVTSFTLNPGGAASTQVSCGSVTAGFATPLKLGVSGAPQWVTITASSATVTPGSGQTNLTISTAGSAPAGSYTFTVTATGGGLSLSLPMSLTINPAPAFTLSLAPVSINVPQGGFGQVTIVTAPTGAFNSAVALSATGMPTGVSASFSQGSIRAPGGGVGTLTIQASAAATAGAYNLTVKATGGGVTKTETLLVIIQAPAAFKLAVAQNSLVVAPSSIAATTVTVSGLVGAFNSAVALSIAPTAGGSLPAGLNPSFTPARIPAPGAGTSILSFAPNAIATPGAYPLTITASGGNLTQTAALTLTVSPPPSFTLHAAAFSLNVLAGGSAGTQITAAALNGFTSLVALSAGALPPGVILTFSPAGMSGNGGHTTINVQTTSAAAPGAYTLKVSATGGNATASVNIALNVGQLVVTPASTALTVKRPNTGSVVITVSVTGAYAGSVTISVVGLPKGVTAAFSPASAPNPDSAAVTLKLTAASTTAPGAYPVTISAASDGVTQSARLTLTVQ